MYQIMKIHLLMALVFSMTPQILKSETANGTMDFSCSEAYRPASEYTASPVTLKHTSAHWFVKKMVGKLAKNKVNPDKYGYLALLLGLLSLGFTFILLYSITSIFLLPALACAGFAVVLGIKGLKKGRKHRWAAILGLIATIPAIATLGFIVAFYIVFG